MGELINKFAPKSKEFLYTQLSISVKESLTTESTSFVKKFGNM
jgi:hypothetical protein